VPKVPFVTVARVEIVEVSPRDGLQNEAQAVSTEDKLRLIDRAISAGIRRLEIASFVNPKRVPQMADAEEVVEKAPRSEDVAYIGLNRNHSLCAKRRAYCDRHDFVSVRLSV
jgi:hydroxymethylglutaryl-CoA lyase